MSRLKTVLAISVGLAATALFAPSVDAAARRHVTCVTIYFSLTTPLGGNTNSSAFDIKNNLSSPIPAGTVFTITAPGVQRTYQASNGLAPGQVLAIPDARITASGACDASFPDTHFGAQTNMTKLNSNGMKLKRSP